MPQRPPFQSDNGGFNGPLGGQRGSKLPASRNMDAGFNPSAPLFPTGGEIKNSSNETYEQPWLINPPAPEQIAEHLRTGRAHELRNKARDRINTVSYMDEALRQRLRNKLRASILPSTENSSEFTYVT